ncbi:MAG: cytochrome C [bacterium]|nr:cytochrome C [bacterium]
MTRFYNFLRGVMVNGLGRTGVRLCTSVIALYLIFEFTRLTGILVHAGVEMLTFMLLIPLFLLGILLIILGWLRYVKRSDKSSEVLLRGRFGADALKSGLTGSAVSLGFLGVVVIGLLFLGTSTGSMLHFMESPRFCGTACHSTMHPEWAAYQNSPHAHVDCVECHVGEGVGNLVQSKLDGLRQMVALATRSYEKPIPTPIHNLRPARETCEECHWPDKFYATRLKVIPHFGMDEASTPTYNALSIKIGSGLDDEGAIHWHVGEENEVRYASEGNAREKMLWVEWRQPDGSFKRFNRMTPPIGELEHTEIRTMDCVDCHNRATHIYQEPEQVVDRLLASGDLDIELPFIKQHAYGALIDNYKSSEAANVGIERRLLNYYSRNYPTIFTAKQVELDRAVDLLQEAWARNVHLGMEVTWGTYPDFANHHGDGGCFRCHNENFVDDQGETISYQCSLCHDLLTQDSPEPFSFKATPDAEAEGEEVDEVAEG